MQPGQAVFTLNDRVKRISTVNIEIADWLAVELPSATINIQDVTNRSLAGTPQSGGFICARTQETGTKTTARQSVRIGVCPRFCFPMFDCLTTTVSSQHHGKRSYLRQRRLRHHTKHYQRESRRMSSYRYGTLRPRTERCRR